MSHTITAEPEGFRVEVHGRLTTTAAFAVIDGLDANGADDSHRYELIDLRCAAPLGLSHVDLHAIARRAMKSTRRKGVRLALVGSDGTLGTNGRDYAHILGTWMSTTAWDVRTFPELDAAKAWAVAAS